MATRTVIWCLVVLLSTFFDQSSCLESTLCLPLKIPENSDIAMGMEEFPKDGWKMFTGAVTDFKDDDKGHDNLHRPILSLYTINEKDAEGRAFNGWLRVEIKMEPDEVDNSIIQAYIICAMDEHKNPVGEFTDNVYFDGKESCEISHVSKYERLQCTAVPAFEPYVPSCAVFHHDTKLESLIAISRKNSTSPGATAKSGFTGSLYWKFSQQACNKKSKIYFKGNMIITTSKGDKVVHPFYQVLTLSDKPSGAADPFPDEQYKKYPHPYCGNKITKNKLPSWIASFEGTNDPKEDPGNAMSYHYPGYGNSDEKTGCKGNMFGGRCVKTISKEESRMSVEEKPSLTNVPRCQSEITKGINDLEEYGEYIKKTFSDSCLTRIINQNRTLRVCPYRLTVETTEVFADKLEGKIIWAMRKGHAIPFVILTTFLLPLSIFMSRYYKETFMKSRVILLHLWYFVHVHSALFMATLVIAGTVVGVCTTRLIGKSLEFQTYLHGMLGWATIGLFGFLLVTGGFRCIGSSSRMLGICFHWLFGTAFYVLNLGLLFHSIYLTGSPTMNTPSSQPQHFLMISLSIWMGFDVIMHVIMSLLLVYSDTQMYLTSPRSYFPTPIPVIQEGDPDDIPGSKVRQGLLILYVCMSVVITFFICFSIQFYSPPTSSENTNFGRFGPMQCTHDTVTLKPVLTFKPECFYYRRTTP